MFSLKSRAWQLGLTGCLLVFTYLVSLTPIVSALEYGLFSYIVGLLPSQRELLAEASIRVAPQWSVLLVYCLILAVYVRKYTRARTTAVSFLAVSIILFVLLMLEVLLAIFGQIFLPVVLPGLVMILVSSIYWIIGLYQRLRSSILLGQAPVSPQDIRKRIDKGELKTALIMLKQCPYSDELLEVGYHLGVSLESSKHWASALNLYHWLSQYDPGLSDFVTRIEEIRKKHPPVNKAVLEDKTLEVIGHYEIVKKIAQGATAIVYEAKDMRTHNRVALKVMSSKLEANIEQHRIEHWLKEAEIVSQFEHKNIARIHDAAVYRNTAYIAMDYIPGYPMSLRLRRREYITVGECLRISKSVLRALAVAHAHGVVHGDIKPANIMYNEREDLYIVTDFGAAYTERKSRHSESIIIGTPSYMSPEQLQGKKLDGRSDLFSLAVTLYHLLSGHQPFTGTSLHLLKQSIINSEPDLSHLKLPDSLKQIILKALQKKTYMRFADAQQMLTAVEHSVFQLKEKIRQKTD
ncbi:MAG: protein kinase [Proteobacteria bacterium]|nr:protein kinase [Pseudomonadota bacterium]